MARPAPASHSSPTGPRNGMAAIVSSAAGIRMPMKLVTEGARYWPPCIRGRNNGPVERCENIRRFRFPGQRRDDMVALAAILGEALQLQLPPAEAAADRASGQDRRLHALGRESTRRSASAGRGGGEIRSRSGRGGSHARAATVRTRPVPMPSRIRTTVPPITAMMLVREDQLRSGSDRASRSIQNWRSNGSKPSASPIVWVTPNRPAMTASEKLNRPAVSTRRASIA